MALELPQGYNDVPSWLPSWLQGSYQALNHPASTITPMAGIGETLPTGLRVLRTTGNLAQRGMMERMVDFLRQRVPSLTSVIAENYDARLRVSPRLDSMGASYWPKHESNTASRLRPTNPPYLDIRMHPNQLLPEQFDSGVKTVLHEFLHPKMANVSDEALGKIAQKAMQTLTEGQNTILGGRTSVLPNPAWYQGRNLLEELAVRMMEENITKKRLMR